MNNTREDVIRRIQSLLALAGSPNENEAVAASTAASRLIEQYAIDMVELEKRNHSKTEEIVQEVAYEATFVTKWRDYMSQGIALANYCKCYVNHTSKSDEVREKLGPRYTSDRWTQVVFYGRKTHVESAVAMYKYLDRVVLLLGNEALKDAQREQSWKTSGWSAWSDSWRKGCCIRLRQRLDDRRHESSSRDESYALAVRNMALVIKEECEQYMQSSGVKLTPGKKSKFNVVPEAYRLGREAADKISLDAQVGGTEKCQTLIS